MGASSSSRWGRGGYVTTRVPPLGLCGRRTRRGVAVTKLPARRDAAFSQPPARRDAFLRGGARPSTPAAAGGLAEAPEGPDLRGMEARPCCCPCPARRQLRRCKSSSHVRVGEWHRGKQKSPAITFFHHHHTHHGDKTPGLSPFRFWKSAGAKHSQGRAPFSSCMAHIHMAVFSRTSAMICARQASAAKALGPEAAIFFFVISSND